MSNQDKVKKDLRKLQLLEEEERRCRERNVSCAESSNTRRDANCVNAEVSAIPVAMASGSQVRPVLQPAQFIVNIPERNQKYIAIRPSASGEVGPIPFSPITGRACPMVPCLQHSQQRPVFNYPVGQPRNVLPTVQSDAQKRMMTMSNVQRNVTARHRAKKAKYDPIPPLIRISNESTPMSPFSKAAYEGNFGSMPPRHEPREPSPPRESLAVNPLIPVWMQEALDDGTQNSADICLKTTSPLELPQFSESQAIKSREINYGCSTSAGKTMMPAPYYFMFPQAGKEEVPSTSGFNMQYECQAPPLAAPMAHRNSSIDVKFSIANILGKEEDSDIPDMPLDLRVTRLTDPVTNIQPAALPTQPPVPNTQPAALPTQSPVPNTQPAALLTEPPIAAHEDSSNEDRDAIRKKNKKKKKSKSKKSSKK